MFENESKEYANKWLEHVKDLALQHKTDEKPEYIRIKEAHQCGAEFAYNKANEWHYVKSEEDLPKDNSEYLLLLEHGIRVFGYYNGKWWESWKGDLSWQEVKAYFFVPVLELPKESE